MVGGKMTNKKKHISGELPNKSNSRKMTVWWEILTVFTDFWDIYVS